MNRSIASHQQVHRLMMIPEQPFVINYQSRYFTSFIVTTNQVQEESEQQRVYEDDGQDRESCYRDPTKHRVNFMNKEVELNPT